MAHHTGAAGQLTTNLELMCAYSTCTKHMDSMCAYTHKIICLQFVPSRPGQRGVLVDGVQLQLLAVQLGMPSQCVHLRSSSAPECACIPCGQGGCCCARLCCNLTAHSDVCRPLLLCLMWLCRCCAPAALLLLLLQRRGVLRPGQDLQRVTFSEVTQKAVREALQHPRQVCSSNQHAAWLSHLHCNGCSCL